MNRARLNAVYTHGKMKRRYEVWFLRLGLANGRGAWWFRYLLMNPGREPQDEAPMRQAAQVWATYFPRDGEPETFIEGYEKKSLRLSGRGSVPFHFRVEENGIEGGKCWGNLAMDGHQVQWRLTWDSKFSRTLSDKGWIGFSRSPYSDATFSGEIELDGERFAGTPLGCGVQGHNCGYRHRSYWRWMHACFRNEQGTLSTLEALVYDLPLGMVFRNVVLWHKGEAIKLRQVKEKETTRSWKRLRWAFGGKSKGRVIEAEVEGRAPGIHELPYTKTDLSGTFPVSNASSASATVWIASKGATERLHTSDGAVVEMGGA